MLFADASFEGEVCVFRAILLLSFPFQFIRVWGLGFGALGGYLEYLRTCVSRGKVLSLGFTASGFGL